MSTTQLMLQNLEDSATLKFGCLEVNVPFYWLFFEYGFVLYLKKVVKISDENKMKLFDEKIKILDLATMIVSFCSFMIFASTYWIVALTSP